MCAIAGFGHCNIPFALDFVSSSAQSAERAAIQAGSNLNVNLNFIYDPSILSIISYPILASSWPRTFHRFILCSPNASQRYSSLVAIGCYTSGFWGFTAECLGCKGWRRIESGCCSLSKSQGFGISCNCPAACDSGSSLRLSFATSCTLQSFHLAK